MKIILYYSIRDIVPIIFILVQGMSVTDCSPRWSITAAATRSVWLRAAADLTARRGGGLHATIASRSGSARLATKPMVPFSGQPFLYILCILSLSLSLYIYMIERVWCSRAPPRVSNPGGGATRNGHLKGPPRVSSPGGGGTLPPGLNPGGRGAPWGDHQCKASEAWGRLSTQGLGRRGYSI